MTTVLITGVGRGIGQELAAQALDRDWRVIGSVRRPLDAAHLELVGGDRFIPLVFDVRDNDSVMAAADSVSEPIDILVNCSGVLSPDRQSVLDMDFEGFADTLNINTIGPLRVTQAFLPRLKQSRAPRVVTLSSYMGSMSHAKSSQIAYRASKAAINKVMQGLATDLEPLGIAVASVHPGWVQTDMGGPGADITPRQSAAGILDICDRLDARNTGQFWNWDSTRLPW